MENETLATVTDPLELLSLSVEEARRRGYSVAGFNLQADRDGFSAWLFDEDDDWTPGVQTNLRAWEEVEVHTSALEAAQDCYLTACRLEHLETELPEA